MGAGAGEQRRDVGYGTEADKNVVVATRDVRRARDSVPHTLGI